MHLRLFVSPCHTSGRYLPTSLPEAVLSAKIRPEDSPLQLCLIVPRQVSIPQDRYYARFRHGYDLIRIDLIEGKIYLSFLLCVFRTFKDSFTAHLAFHGSQPHPHGCLVCVSGLNSSWINTPSDAILISEIRTFRILHPIHRSPPARRLR